MDIDPEPIKSFIGKIKAKSMQFAIIAYPNK
jgi:hypothetical protein